MQLRVIYEVGLVFIWEIPCKIELMDWLYIKYILQFYLYSHRFYGIKECHITPGKLAG